MELCRHTDPTVVRVLPAEPVAELHAPSGLDPSDYSLIRKREAIEGGGFSHLHFRWGLGLNMIYLILAILFFRSMFEAARSRALLVKME